MGLRRLGWRNPIASFGKTQMPDGGKTTSSQVRDWAAQVRIGLDGQLQNIAETFFQDQTAEHLAFDLINQTDEALNLRVRHNGRSIHIKLFDVGSEASESQFRRERNSLLVFRSSGLVPRILGFEKQKRFIVSEFIEGISLASADTKLNASETAERLGLWLAKNCATAPVRSASSNWFNYLTNNEAGIDLKFSPSDQATLGQIQITQMALSRGNASLENYVLSPEGKVIGTNFEHACLRPHGWDYLMACHALVERFGATDPTPLRTFRDTFHEHRKDASITHQLGEVARVLSGHLAHVAQRAGDEDYLSAG